MPGGTPKICGREGIARFFAGAKKMGMASFKLTTVEVTGGKELVSEEGSYEISGADGKALDKGKYIVNWIQEDGQWKIYRDIWNTDMPPPPPPPVKK
jgi:ketosteroid isomerase-like protein